MIGTALYLDQPFAQHALLGATIAAVICGLVGPFVVSRGLAFAVHGTSELAFTGAAGGLVVAENPIAGALVGTLIVALVIGALGVNERERDSTIGVILAFGLGIGVLLLSHYHGFATSATNVLFGNILGISTGQLGALVAIGVVVVAVLVVTYRPLLFASIDPDVAAARGVRTRALGIVFMLALALAVTSAAQVVGTLLVLSLAITPAAAAQRLTARPLLVTALSIVIALVAADGGVLWSLAGTTRPTVLVTAISFACYVVARALGPRLTRARPGAVTGPSAP